MPVYITNPNNHFACLSYDHTPNTSPAHKAWLGTQPMSRGSERDAAALPWSPRKIKRVVGIHRCPSHMLDDAGVDVLRATTGIKWHAISRRASRRHR